MKESSLVSLIKKDLKNRFPGSKVIKIHGNQFMEIGLPDINACIAPYGKTLVIETKVHKNTPTEMQLYRLKEYQDAGAISFWCNSFEDYLDKIKKASL